jgi:hypothetical protein
MLVEQTREYMRSDLFVLSYPTFYVTAPDGKFEITQLPVGNVKVSVYAPAFGKVVEQRVDIAANTTAELSVELAFSQAEYEESMRRASESAGSPAPQATPPAK